MGTRRVPAVYNIRVDQRTADQAAIDACLAGDREAFAPLVAEYQQAAFRAAYLILRDAESARDVAQEAFVRAYRSLPSFQRGSAFRPWLLRIVTNLALNETRSRNRRGNLFARLARLAPVSGPGPAPSAEQGETRDLLSEAINRLPHNDRVVLYLRHYLDLPEAEIAVAIGQRPGTVKSRLSRASARLRTVIERDYPSLVPSATTEVSRDPS